MLSHAGQIVINDTRPTVAAEGHILDSGVLVNGHGVVV
jgi:hypothetical protein